MFKNLLVISALLTSVSAFAKIEKVNVDTTGSKVIYTGMKAIVDSKHTGEVKLKDGFLSFDGDTFKGGELTIDMATISNTDLTDAEYNKKFVGHITGEDFFDVKKFPTTKIVIKSATKDSGDNYTVVADLTIKGKTAPVTFPAVITKKVATASITVDRTAHDVKYGSGKFFQGLGDKAIADNMIFAVSLKIK